MMDTELSLAVAKIMRPEYEWRMPEEYDIYCIGEKFINGKLASTEHFLHTTDDALGKMCVWLAHNKPMCSDEYLMQLLLRDNNPHRAIAEAILEANQ